VSQGGVSARAPHANEEWLAIGTLIATRAYEGADREHWQIGVVQRLRRSEEGDILVGIELLSKAPRAMLAVPDRLSPENAIGIVLLGALSSGGEASILVRPGRHVPTTGYFVRNGNRSFRLDPEQILRTGADYELIACHVKLRHTAWEPVG